jgi:DUF4097 and DUF4098 domain-containing protein YvlB
MKRILVLTCLMLAVALQLSAAGSAYEQRIGSLLPNGDLTIKTDSAALVVSQDRGNDKLDIQLTGVGRSNYNLTVRENRGDVTIEVKRKKQWLVKVFQVSEVKLTVRIPSSWKSGALELGTVSGSIRIDSDLVGEKIKIGSVSGAISFKSFTADKAISLQSVSGRIAGDKISSYEAKVESVSGAIAIERVDVDDDGTLDVSSISGRITLPRMNATTASIHSISGAIDCTIPASFNGRLSLKTVSGSVDSSIKGSLSDETNGKTRVYTLGKGYGYIEISSTSGRVSLHN